jgi:hypothetical protein
MVSFGQAFGESRLNFGTRSLLRRSLTWFGMQIAFMSFRAQREESFLSLEYAGL